MIFLHFPLPQDRCNPQWQRKQHSAKPYNSQKLLGLVPNLYIYVSVSYLFIPRIGPPILLYCVCEPIVGIYKSLTDTRMGELGTRPHSFISGNICFEFSVQCICSVATWRHLSLDNFVSPDKYQIRKLFMPSGLNQLYWRSEAKFLDMWRGKIDFWHGVGTKYGIMVFFFCWWTCNLQP